MTDMTYRAVVVSEAGSSVTRTWRLATKPARFSCAADTVSGANRIALKHALLVRDYLVGKGIDEARVIVRALGPAQNGPADRVDIEFLLN